MVQWRRHKKSGQSIEILLLLLFLLIMIESVANQNKMETKSSALLPGSVTPAIDC